MMITEPHTLSASQVNDILDLMRELNSDLVVTPEMLTKSLASASSHFFAIVDDDDHIAGCATLCVYDSPTGQKASLEDVVVSSKYRGQGLGELLVQHVISFARRELENVDIHLTSRPHRVAANKLYQNLGFEKRETNAYEMRVRAEES